MTAALSRDSLTFQQPMKCPGNLSGCFDKTVGTSVRVSTVVMWRKHQITDVHFVRHDFNKCLQKFLRRVLSLFTLTLNLRSAISLGLADKLFSS